jgi:hypothetical protein
MHKPLAIALALALAAPAAAADTADARARAVAPFLDEQTVAVARFDLTTVDADALLTVLGAFGQIDADEVQDLKKSTERWLGDFRKAGGKDLYLVFSLADVPNVPFVIVPLGAGADARALAGLLDLRAVQPGAREKLGDVVFAGTRAALERVRALKPTPHPDLAKALAAAGGAAQVALVPPPHLVRVVEELMPALPKEVGGGSSRVLTRGLKWAALGLDAPPKMSLRLTVQAADAASAQALKDAFGRALKALGEQKEARAVLPDFDKAAALLAPKVEQDRAVLTLDDKEMRVVLQPLVRRAVLAARRVESTNHLKELALAVHSYVDANTKLPAVANLGKDGKPLLSWRVHVLPYLGEEKLYKEFHLDEPWDSEHNKALLARMPDAFRGPSHKLNGQGKTVFLAPVGKDLAFTGGPAGRRFPQEFTDGTSNTILLVEADDAHAVEWTRPGDLTIDPARPGAGLASQAGAFLLALADGTVRTVPPTISKETLWAAFTANGGEVLGKDW